MTTTAAAMTASLADLSGRIRLCPGARPDQAAIVSTRPDLAPRLAVGRPAAQVPALLASLFTLCAHAHRWTAQQALRAAEGEPGPPSAADRQTLRWVTLREQLLRIAHEWPRRLPGAAAGADTAAAVRVGAAFPVQPEGQGMDSAPGADFALAACPLWRRPDPSAWQAPAFDTEVAAWLGSAWLGCSPAAWLQAHAADPEGWPRAWAAQTDTAPARLLRSQMHAASALRTPGAALDVLPSAAIALPMLARQMRVPGFCSRPRWQHECVDTGPWRRAADPLRYPADTVWTRLVLRLVEVLRLASAGGEHWLGHGALSLGPGAGVAWTEMARGLLVHRVQLVPGAAPGAATVADWRVLAPTEWNFHPDGVLAQALRRLAPDDLDGAARLAVAFDPCVDVELVGVGEDRVPAALTGACPHA